MELSRYVHLNPVRLKDGQSKSLGEKIRYLGRYRWSSLPGYLKASNKQSWVHYDAVLEQVGGSRGRYAEFVRDGIARL